MDTSETYIKMCEKAEEIQKLAPALDEENYRELFVCGKCGWHYHEDDGYYYVSCEHDEPIWLPRQDQLQEMMGKDWIVQWLVRNLWGFLHHNFYLHDSENREGYYSTDWTPLSMEQLWLAFVMNEKYGKVWNGAEWIES